MFFLLIKRNFILFFIAVFITVYFSKSISASKTQECINPCGPSLCCKLQESCKFNDPCVAIPPEICTSVPSFECVPSKLFTNLLQTVGEVNLLIKDLRKASKFARPVTSEIKFLLKEITKALNFHEDACKEKAINAVVKLNAVISKLKSKQCIEVELRTRSFKKCIPGDVVEEFLPKLQFSYEKISAFFQTDNNANLIPDLCEQVEVVSVTPTPSPAGDLTSPTSTPQGDVVTQELKITSPAFENNQSIPIQYTCDSKNISPPLRFEGIPSNTKSLAILLDDPDAPGGTFIHWIIFNIPPDATTLIENASQNLQAVIGDAALPSQTNAKQGLNGFGQVGYGGPCPPPGETHRYIFKLFALDNVLDLENSSSKEQFLSAISNHILQEAVLIGKYKTVETRENL